LGTIFAPDVDFIDHRPIGLPSCRGRDAYLSSLRAFLELTGDAAIRVDDVLALRPDAFVFRVTSLGTGRASGGAFESPTVVLSVFDADGLATHWEFFSPDRDEEAPTRFDELTGETPPLRLVAAPPRAPAKSERRVRPNAATALTARADAAIAAR